MRQLRDQKGSGPFLARNQFRIMHSRAKACPSSGSFAETGPGAREMLNLLNGLAHQFSFAASSQDACDSYSHLLLQAHKRFLADFKKRVREASDDDEVQWLERSPAGAKRSRHVQAASLRCVHQEQKFLTTVPMPSKRSKVTCNTKYLFWQVIIKVMQLTSALQPAEKRSDGGGRCAGPVDSI